MLTGRELPRAVIAGSEAFDATQSFLSERDKPLPEQSTASLLMTLRILLVGHAMFGTSPTLDHSMNVWGELNRRIPGLETVFVGGITRLLGSMIAMRVVLEHMAGAGKLDLADVLGGNRNDQDTQERNWLTVAEESLRRNLPRHEDHRRNDSPDWDGLQEIFPHLFDSAPARDWLRSSPLATHVLSAGFQNRVARWYANLIGDDLTATLSMAVPTPALFTALNPSVVRDHSGAWLWERFTLTSLDDWSTASLVSEWAWVQGSPTALCNGRAMAERRIPADALSERVMRRAAEAGNHHRGFRRGFTPHAFAKRASELLLSGEPEEACRLFEGLAELNPGDADTWNNLGFCELVIEPARALVSLRRAAALYRKPSVICNANQVIAMHLLGDDPGAIELGRSTLEMNAHDPGPCYVWDHPNEDPDTELVQGNALTATSYLENLLAHIEGGPCASQRAS